MEKGLDWNQLYAITGIVFTLVGAAGVVLKLTISNQINTAVTDLKEHMDALYVRKDVSNLELQNINDRLRFGPYSPPSTRT